MPVAGKQEQHLTKMLSLAMKFFIFLDKKPPGDALMSEGIVEGRAL